MPIMTVRGEIEKGQCGLTLSHEHVFIDLRNQFSEPDDADGKLLARQMVSTRHSGVLNANPYAMQDNLLLDDFEIAAAELEYFKSAGGATVVDCTSRGINPRPELLEKLARRTGINIVAGCGFYTQDTHPAGLHKMTPDQVAAIMIHDLRAGIGETGIRAGIIGEIGTSHPVHPDEWKVLEAAAIAHARTGAAMQVHTYPWAEHGLEIAGFLTRLNVAPEKVVICHSDVKPDEKYIRALLAAGVYVQFDNFGKEFKPARNEKSFAQGSFASDRERVALMKKLVDSGHARRLLITNDICLKCMLHEYGGQGYDHIPRNIVPLLAGAGLAPETILNTMLINNPAELLDKA